VIGIFTVIGIIVTITLLITGRIDKKIEDKIKDPIFIRKLADEVKLPFLIFDEKNTIIADYGAYEYLEKITVIKNSNNELEAIRITPKHFMNTAPIIENINGDLNLSEPKRTDQIDWLILINPGSALLASESHVEPIKKFKLTILK